MATPEITKLDVVVLASGVNQVPLFEGYVPGYKALLPYHGKASIQYVLEALRGVPTVGRICVEGPCQQLQQELAAALSEPDHPLTLIEGGTTFLESLVLGLEHFSTSKRVLFITADLPLVTPAAIQDFLEAGTSARTGDAQLAIAVVPRSCYTGPYHHFTKPFNRYRDIAICHGNLFLVDPQLLKLPQLKEKINKFYAGRKNALLTTLALGWRLALVYMIGVELLHILTLRQLARFTSRQLGFTVAPVLVSHPGISIDVDEPDDYAFVRDRIEESWH
jgi:CTP:molybdopterin cytidylyltransferase MocA